MWCLAGKGLQISSSVLCDAGMQAGSCRCLKGLSRMRWQRMAPCGDCDIAICKGGKYRLFDHVMCRHGAWLDLPMQISACFHAHSILHILWHVRLWKWQQHAGLSGFYMAEELCGDACGRVLERVAWAHGLVISAGCPQSQDEGLSVWQPAQIAGLKGFAMQHRCIDTTAGQPVVLARAHSTDGRLGVCRGRVLSSCRGSDH